MNSEKEYEFVVVGPDGRRVRAPAGQQRGRPAAVVPTERELAAAEIRARTLRSRVEASREQTRVLESQLVEAEKEVRALQVQKELESEALDQVQNGVRAAVEPLLLATLLTIMQGVFLAATGVDASERFRELAGVFTRSEILDTFAEVRELERVSWVRGLFSISQSIANDKRAAATVTAAKLERSGFAEFAGRVGTALAANYGFGDRPGQYTVRLSSSRPGMVVLCGLTDSICVVEGSLVAALLQSCLPLQINGQPLCRENGEFFVLTDPEAFAKWEAVQVANRP